MGEERGEMESNILSGIKRQFLAKLKCLVLIMPF
jgi:hypothetical protein